MQVPILSTWPWVSWGAGLVGWGKELHWPRSPSSASAERPVPLSKAEGGTPWSPGQGCCALGVAKAL